MTQNDVDALSDESGLYYASTGTAYEYLLQSSGGKLQLRDTQNANASVDAGALNLSAIGHDWGVQSGEMVLSTSGIANPWDVYQQPVTYRWETGSQGWNHLTTVTADSDDAQVSFDKPLHFTYTVAAGDDLNGDAHAGDTYLLQYGGPGNLWGFPWEQTDSANRWYSVVNLRNGVELTEDGTATKMVLRPIEMEQSMNATGSCGALSTTLAQELSLPDGGTGSVGFTWLDRPTPASDAPAAIEGVLQ
jgi:hypothetical protein